MAVIERRAVASGPAAPARADLAVTGMTCAACARRIERRLSKTEGVADANVNFATSRATVHFDPARTGVRQLVEVVRSVGYGAAVPGDGGLSAEDARRAEQRDL